MWINTSDAKCTYFFIIDSVEINKAIAVNEITAALTSNTKYVPVNGIDHNFVKELIFYNMVRVVVKRVEDDVELEKQKEYIIIDAPLNKNKTNNTFDDFPII
ncbi:MAG TPA: hypothetical protein DDX39_09680 [Bacteroidales bacterium]|nr:MAG: hypothetical protein A2W98_01695 [Bacteroidetes bacterium GWF2_33_38]OFY74350.1 MAG: hypothetical protein A2265_06245 [Bacteroidetes bacterium RIFOXYA12_FULL_33_9]OFY84733.1 MAG: hypothetical protein A2236_04975 [Bacteroidetes bacterium RIFOXYA2_FULL_33_7]HBF88898.1 hypothetical protein [Bacteroidales bacterium]